MFLRNHFGPVVLRSLSSANLESLAGGQLKNEIRDTILRRGRNWQVGFSWTKK